MFNNRNVRRQTKRIEFQKIIRILAIDFTLQAQTQQIRNLVSKPIEILGLYRLNHHYWNARPVKLQRKKQRGHRLARTGTSNDQSMFGQVFQLYSVPKRTIISGFRICRPASSALMDHSDTNEVLRPHIDGAGWSENRAKLYVRNCERRP